MSNKPVQDLIYDMIVAAGRLRHRNIKRRLCERPVPYAPGDISEALRALKRASLIKYTKFGWEATP